MATQAVARTGALFMLRCWGDFALTDGDGAERRPRGRKARALIAYLAMHPDRPVGRERLAALLWGDRAEEQARSSLRQSLFELKDLTNGAGLLAVERDAVMLHAAALETDIARMQAHLSQGAFEALLNALPDPDERLFANLDDLDEGFDEWLRAERVRRRDELVALTGEASARAVAVGQARTARALHARLLAYEPEDGRPSPALAPVLLGTPPIDARPVETARPSRRMLLAGGAAAAMGALGVGGWWVMRDRGTVRPEVRELFETANAIIYERRSASLPMAAELLRRAVALDPDYAPAWAGLAAATAMSNRTSEGMAEAERLARRAIAIDPKLGKAHGILGMALGFTSTEARAEIRKAAALDSGDPEILFWLSNVHGVEGNHPAKLDALRRAAAIDPMWHRSSGAAALSAHELGYHDEAQRHIARVARSNVRAAFSCDYSVDWARGAYAEVVRTVMAQRPKLQQADLADWKLGNALLVLGHVEPARLLLRMPTELWEVARGGPPSGAGFERINREAELAGEYDFCLSTAVRQLLKAGRGSEIIALYDAREGRAGVFRKDPHPSALLIGGVDMALALRQAGRAEAAEALLAQTEAAMRRSYGFGPVPNWLDANAAQLWAARGRDAEAVAALGQAMDRGWHYASVSPLPDLADVPGFETLAGDPGFEALRQRQREHLERERRALGPVPV